LTGYKETPHELPGADDQLHARRSGRRRLPRRRARRLRDRGAARAARAGASARAEHGVPAASRVARRAPRRTRRPRARGQRLAARRRVAELAAEHGFWILEDAPYRPLRYRGTELVSLRELSPARTLHMSSFTKQISPGVRVGYLIGDARVVARISKAAEDTYITPNLLGQAAVYE